MATRLDPSRRITSTTERAIAIVVWPAVVGAILVASGDAGAPLGGSASRVHSAA